jgi:hypothetical protein
MNLSVTCLEGSPIVKNSVAVITVLYYPLLKTSPTLRSKSSCSRHCLLDVNNTPPSWFRLNDLPRMTSQRIVKRRSSASTNCSWLQPAAWCTSLLRNRISQPVRAWVFIHSVCFTTDEERVWRPVKAPGIITMKHVAVMHWPSCCTVGTMAHRQKGAKFYLTMLSVAEVIGWMTLAGKRGSTPIKTCPFAALSFINPTGTGLEWSPDLRGDWVEP